MVWPHLQIVLAVIGSTLMQPLAPAAYVAYLLLCILISFGLGLVSMLADKSTGTPVLGLSERKAALQTLNRLALQRSATGVVVIAGTGLGLGVIGFTVLGEWSLDNAVCCLLIVASFVVALSPLFLINYFVWRFYLFRFGYFVPVPRPLASAL